MDRIANDELKLEYCPTGEMLGDFFTKPLQGCIFKKVCDHVLNLNDDPIHNHCQDCRSVLGNNMKEARLRTNMYVTRG
jgi:hypothetical protein